MTSPTLDAAELLLLGLESFIASRASHCSVRGVPWRAKPGRPRQADTPHEQPEALHCAIRAFGGLLRLAPAGMPLRQFLTTTLERVPADPAADGRRRSAISRLRAVKWSRLLDLDCEGVAEVLSSLTSELVGEDDHRRAWENARYQREVEAQRKADLRRVQEPVPFRCDRKSYHFPYRQSLLLECLRSAKRVESTAVIEHVWGFPAGGPARLENALHKLQSDTNARLLKLKLPFKIARPLAGHLSLVRLPREG